MQCLSSSRQIASHRIPSLLVAGLVLLLLAVGNGQAASHTDAVPWLTVVPVHFGFNARGMLDPVQQTAWADEFFSRMSDRVRRGLVIRVTGGTSSQTTYASDWSDEAVAAWVALQQQQGIRFIYVVNGNGTPQNQRDAIQRWLDAGARFDFIEMMNEYYLPKYARGDTSRPEVTRKVTAESYVNEILPAFWAELDRFHLPYYLILAPSRPDRLRANARMAHWNDVIIHAITTAWADRNLGVTLHLYATGNINQVDYSQIDRLRARLPTGMHIAITEAGIINKKPGYLRAGLANIRLHRRILEHLKPGDYLLDQILYHTGKNNNTASLSPVYGGITPKGREMIAFINHVLHPRRLRRSTASRTGHAARPAH